MDKNGWYCILTKGGALSSYVESLAESAATYIPFAEPRILWDTLLTYMECGYMFTFLLIHGTFYFYLVFSISTSIFPVLPLTRLIWLIHTSVLPSNWNPDKIFAPTGLLGQVHMVKKIFLKFLHAGAIFF